MNISKSTRMMFSNSDPFNINIINIEVVTFCRLPLRVIEESVIGP